MNKSKQNIEKGFSKISSHYEQLDKTSSLINWMRKRVRKHLHKELKPIAKILEINCGSGIDAVYFAKKGYNIHATDIAPGMIDVVTTKIKSESLKKNLSCQRLSFNELNKLNPQKYNHIFSNFGGLNCSSEEELQEVFGLFKQLLSPNGKITLVLMPKICAWEFLKILKGNKTAFRRLKKDGVFANIEGEQVHTFYHSASRIKNLLLKDFKNFKVENICFLAPTGNHVDFPEKYPVLFNTLSLFDTISNKIPFFRGYGDYYILTASLK